MFLASTGAEANEGAVKLARKWGQLHRGGAYKVITTAGQLSRAHAGDDRAPAASRAGTRCFRPAVPGFVKVPFGDLAAVARAIDADTVAVMVEPIQGEGGVVVPPPGYLAGLRALTARARRAADRSTRCRPGWAAPARCWPARPRACAPT